MTNTLKLNKDLLVQQHTDYAQLKRLIWLYFWLLIFEGALRKWIFPSLSDVLLIVRDPVAIYILIKAARHNIYINNPYFITAVFVSLVSFIMTIFVGHGNLTVAIYGLRIMLLHFPLIFVIGRVFNRMDVIRIGKVLLFMAPFMAVLIGLQFYSPQSAWVNRGLRGSLEGAGFSGANGFFRPPGVFSFTHGNASFWGLVTAFIAFFWLHALKIPKVLLITVTASLVAAVAFSISRTLVFQLVVTITFMLIASANKPIYAIRIVVGIVLALFVVLIVSQLSVFEAGFGAFTTRFESASNAEGGMEGIFVDRFLGGMFGAIRDTPNFWGMGLGMGTNAGAKLITGSATFLISEGEWGRLIGESGLILGLIFILIRVVLSVELLRKAYRKIEQGNSLPWMLLSYGLINLLQAQWAQPTALGFSVFTGGLVMAALKSPRPTSQSAPKRTSTPPPSPL